ncbi:MAG: HAMP domain-containing sensor histidine kinase, partial [Bacteroidota bacterium]
IKVYLPEDGITFREFNRAAHQTDTLGNLYFGSLNGITYFHPKDFVDRFREIPNVPLLLTEYKLIAGSSEKRESRMASFLATGQIVLHPGDRHLQLGFALLDYACSNPQGIQYVYSLNEDELWNIGTNNRINFDGLAYGTHILKVKARTGNGQFSKQDLTIPIVVLKPFYLQSWFVALGVMLLIGISFMLQKLKTRSLLKRQEELEKEVQQRTQTIQAQAETLRQLDKTKSRFLANISHEFRTPLTLILNTLDQEAIEKITTTKELLLSAKEVSIMQRNATRLQQLINQLLDLSKLESGKMVLRLKNGDFNFYLQQLVQSFEPLAKRKGLALNYQSDLKKKQLQFDRDKIDKIVYNLLSNAIKFTTGPGRIEVRLFQADAGIRLEVEDSG